MLKNEKCNTLSLFIIDNYYKMKTSTKIFIATPIITGIIAFVIMILGSVCMSYDNYDKCGSKPGAISMVVVGVIVLVIDFIIAFIAACVGCLFGLVYLGLRASGQ